MSGSNLNLGSTIASQAVPKNLASASVTAATSLLYSGLGSASLKSGVLSSAEMETSRWDESKQKSTSLSGRYTSATTTTTSNSTTAVSNGASTTSHSNGSSTTGTGGGHSNGNSTGSYTSSNYRLASLDRLAQRQKLYENGSGTGDNVSQ